MSHFHLAERGIAHLVVDTSLTKKAPNLLLRCPEDDRTAEAMPFLVTMVLPPLLFYPSDFSHLFSPTDSVTFSSPLIFFDFFFYSGHLS